MPIYYSGYSPSQLQPLQQQAVHQQDACALTKEQPSPQALTKEQRFTLIQIAATTSNQSLMEAALALLAEP